MNINSTTSSYSSSTTTTRAKPVALSEILGLLSFMFLAMALGARLVPPDYQMQAFFAELALLFIIPVVNRRALANEQAIMGGAPAGLALVFAACSGAVISPTIQYYLASPADTNILTQAGAITFIVFAICGAYGFMTKRNLAPMAKGLLIALLVLLAVLIISMFSSVFSGAGLLIGIAGSIIFSLLTMLDFQRAKYSTEADAVMITLSIFLDFVNLFLFILRIMRRVR